VIGLCSAYYLARGGARVVLLESHRVGAGASSGNAGTVSPGHPPLNRPGRVSQGLRQLTDPSSPLYVHPRWDPGLWRWLLGFARYCTDAHVEHAVGVMAPMGLRSLALFDELIRGERIECEYRAEGYYDVCATEAGWQESRHEAELVRPYGYAPEILDGEELRRREPALGPNVCGGVFHPDAATLDPGLFVDRLATVVRRLGVEIREGARVRSVETRSGRATGVRVDGAAEGADAVVLATGPFSLRVARRVGARLPVQPGKGYHRDVPVGPNGAPAMRVACVLVESSVFCTPLYTALRLAGTMEFSGANLIVRPEPVAQLTRAAKACIPALGPARPTSVWCGLRPMSVDGLPIVGRVGGVEGLSVATGHGMLGLTQAPVTGEMIANHVLASWEGPPEALSPDRF